jgi:hypothetical protein
MTRPMWILVLALAGTAGCTDVPLHSSSLPDAPRRQEVLRNELVFVPDAARACGPQHHPAPGRRPPQRC